MYLYRNFLLKIKTVEGSGSEGASKYMGEGVTYGVLLVIFLHVHVPADVHMHQVTDAWHQEAHTVAYINHNVTS